MSYARAPSGSHKGSLEVSSDVFNMTTGTMSDLHLRLLLQDFTDLVGDKSAITSVSKWKE